MLQQLNEFKYQAETGKVYVVYFLKFWEAGDFIVKYQITASDRDFFWYGRISKERALLDLKISEDEAESMAKDDFQNKIREHLKMLFTSVMKKGLDKGFEESNTEFMFFKEPAIAKRVWQG